MCGATGCGCPGWRRGARARGVAARSTSRTRLLLFAAAAYGMIWLALAPALTHRPPRHADLSYGTYLYGWPVQQTLHALFPAATAAGAAAAGVVLTLAVAALSWFVVEKPALALKGARRSGGGRLEDRSSPQRPDRLDELPTRPLCNSGISPRPRPSAGPTRRLQERRDGRVVEAMRMSAAGLPPTIA